MVFAKDINNKEVDPPMEIHVSVEDVNDNAPVCAEEETVFEVQENEPAGNQGVASCQLSLLDLVLLILLLLFVNLRNFNFFSRAFPPAGRR